jgi:hypothetical protein
MGGDELEEIESDVFGATRSGVVAGFHGYLSERVAKGDGSGLREMVATWRRCRAALGALRARWNTVERSGPVMRVKSFER